MAEIRFPLEIFGLRDVKPYEFEPEPTYEVQLEKAVGTRQAPAKSYLGGHVIDNLAFIAGSYTDRDSNRQSYGGLTLETVLMRVTQSKQIVMTKIAGRPGSVKEYIAEDDFRIQIYGSLQRPDNTYPEDEIDRLIELCQVPAAIEVVSPFLQLFGIDSIVIDSYNLQQRPGYENQQLFELSALSDRAIELVLSDEEA